MKTTLVKNRKLRRLLIAIPLLTLPFILLLFWLLGGGRSAAQQSIPVNTGLNTVLPEPDLKSSETDKLSLYKQAVLDSLKLEEQMRNDPYYSNVPAGHDTTTPETYTSDYMMSTGMQTRDANVDRVHSKLNELYKVIDQQQALPAQPYRQESTEMLASDAPSAATDPEMAQLDDMLDKIMDIQNPQLAREKLKQQSMKNRKGAFPVVTAQPQPTVTTLAVEHSPSGTRRTAKKATQAAANAFFDWSDQPELSVAGPNAVDAIIAQTATVTTGATIRLKLLDDVYISGMLLKAGTFVHGICALSGDRLNIQFSSIRSDNALYPVNLVAYDMDGLAGIYMPGAMSRDVAKNSAQEAVQGVDYYSMDNSIGTQAASVGIQAAKSLLTKKAKLIKVTVRAGYRLLLRDPNAQL